MTSQRDDLPFGALSDPTHVAETWPDRDGVEAPTPRRRIPGVDAVEGAVETVLGPLTRTSRYYAGAWRHYLRGGSDALPLARPSVALIGHALGDELVLAGLRTQRPMSNAETFERINREVREALDFYGRRGWLHRPDLFFAAPTAPTDMAIHPVTKGGRSYERFVFGSGYTPEPGDPGAQRWLGYTANDRVYGLMLRHPEPRPWVVCVHGTEMGRAGVDLAVFRAWHLHEDFGLNVVLPVLPQHGPRARQLPKGKAIPGEEVLDDVHFAGQAVWDIRRLLCWIRAQEPESKIGLNSISLGGYVAALVASLDDDLSCAILGVPVADLVELLGRHAGFRSGDPRRHTMELAAPLGRMVSPLSLTPRVPMAGRFIYGGVADRLVHPRDQVVRLWKHWGSPEIVWYRGGHTASLTARPVQEFVDVAIAQSGLVDATG